MENDSPSVTVIEQTDGMSRLRLQNTELLIVGTAHVLSESVEHVRTVIAEEFPDVVAIELDQQRFLGLEGKEPEISLKDIIKQGKLSTFLIGTVLGVIQRRIGADLGVEPGAEMRASADAAREIGAHIALIDRDIQTSLSRLWGSMGLIEKGKLILSVVGGFRKQEVDDVDIENIMEGGTIEELLGYLKEFSPTAYEVLVHERDLVMAERLRELDRNGSQLRRGGESNFMTYPLKVVAVVGAGHVKGITEALVKGCAPPIVEEKRHRIPWGKVIGALIGVGVVGLFVLSFMKLSFEGFVMAFAYWFIINGVLSATGAALARGHPLSILTAFLVAWMTSLSPMLAAGWFAGLVELWVRDPSSNDLKAMVKINSFSEMWKNNAFRVIFVAALTNVGSAIGTFLSAYIILKMLGITF